VVDHRAPSGRSELLCLSYIEKISSHVEKKERLAKSIGYHIASGFIVKVPSWVNLFIHSTHPLETELASPPPNNLLGDTAYVDDPSRIVASYHADWWNSPGGALIIPKAYSQEETAAFNHWLTLANQVRSNSHILIYLSLRII